VEREPDEVVLGAVVVTDVVTKNSEQKFHWCMSEHILSSLKDKLLSSVRDSRFTAIVAKEYSNEYRYGKVV